MNEKEKLMYTIMGSFNNINAPIVFKGAMITKLILMENNFNHIIRESQDIDANWIDKPPPIEVLVDIVNKAISNVSDKIYAIATKDYAENRTARLSIISKESNNRICTMDINMRPIVGVKTYYWGEMSIKGVLPDEILSDKISVISGDSIYKSRAKDLVDVYCLTNCVVVKTTNIYNTCKQKNREISDFDAFYNKRDAVEYAYNKLKKIEGKPPFEEIYSYISKFIKPFAEKDYRSKTWNSSSKEWQEEKQLNIPVKYRNKEEREL